MGYKKKVLEMPICSSKGDTDAGIQGCGEHLRVIPYHFSKSSHMTSLELGETWCTSSPRGSIIPAGV